jgi:transketolase
MDSIVDMRDAFIGELYQRTLTDKNIVFMSVEFGAPSLDAYRRDFPNQFINIGISEQNLISVAAGLALAGKSVFAYSIASFLTLRCYEQIKIDLCAMNLPVTLLGVGPCYAYSEDGPTHHATEDVSVMRALANMAIYSPSDSESARAMVDLSLRSTSPTYIRLDRGKYTPFLSKADDMSAGFRLIEDGQDICIIASSGMVHRAVSVAAMLAEKGISACIIDIYRLKPINSAGLVDRLCKFSKVATLEEHTLNGGLGSIILELISDEDLGIMVKRFGIEDSQLYAYGKRDTMHYERGIDSVSITESIKSWLNKH